jgi:hypothetical protein
VEETLRQPAHEQPASHPGDPTSGASGVWNDLCGKIWFSPYLVPEPFLQKFGRSLRQYERYELSGL